MYYYIQHIRAFVPIAPKHRCTANRVQKNQKENTGKTILAVKNNLLYDIALAPNIEIEVPIGRQWSLNAEYKCPWWSDSNKEICYQLLSGGIESRFWLGNRAGRRQLTGHFIGLYAEGGHLRLPI